MATTQRGTRPGSERFSGRQRRSVSVGGVAEVPGPLPTQPSNEEVKKLTLRRPQDVGRRSSAWAGVIDESDEDGVLVLKLLVAGDSNCGKTQLVRRFAENEFSEKHVPSIGVDFLIKNYEVDGRPIVAQIWDTAGLESNRTKGKSFYLGTQAILLVFDLTNRQTFDNLDEHYNRVMQLGGLPADVPLVVIGNKRDAIDRIKVAQDEVLQWMRSRRPDLPESMEYIDTSAKDDVNVVYAFGKAIEMAEQAVYRSRRPDTQHPDVAPEPEPEEPRSRSRASTWSTADSGPPEFLIRRRSSHGSDDGESRIAENRRSLGITDIPHLPSAESTEDVKLAKPGKLELAKDATSTDAASSSAAGVAAVMPSISLADSTSEVEAVSGHRLSDVQLASQDDAALARRSLSKPDQDALKQALSGLTTSSAVDSDLIKPTTQVGLVSPTAAAAVAPTGALLSANPFDLQSAEIKLAGDAKPELAKDATNTDNSAAAAAASVAPVMPAIDLADSSVDVAAASGHRLSDVQLATQDEDALSLSKRDEDVKQALSRLEASFAVDAAVPKSSTDVELVTPETTAAVAPNATLLSANPFDSNSGLDIAALSNKPEAIELTTGEDADTDETNTTAEPAAEPAAERTSVGATPWDTIADSDASAPVQQDTKPEEASGSNESPQSTPWDTAGLSEPESRSNSPGTDNNRNSDGDIRLSTGSDSNLDFLDSAAPFSLPGQQSPRPKEQQQQQQQQLAPTLVINNDQPSQGYHRSAKKAITPTRHYFDSADYTMTGDESPFFPDTLRNSSARSSRSSDPREDSRPSSPSPPPAASSKPFAGQAVTAGVVPTDADVEILLAGIAAASKRQTAATTTTGPSADDFATYDWTKDEQLLQQQQQQQQQPQQAAAAPAATTKKPETSSATLSTTTKATTQAQTKPKAQQPDTVLDEPRTSSYTNLSERTSDDEDDMVFSPMHDPAAAAGPIVTQPKAGAYMDQPSVNDPSLLASAPYEGIDGRATVVVEETCCWCLPAWCDCFGCCVKTTYYQKTTSNSSTSSHYRPF